MFNTKSSGAFIGDFITETISYMLCITYYNETNYIILSSMNSFFRIYTLPD